jgi:hypothetical protein
MSFWLWFVVVVMTVFWSIDAYIYFWTTQKTFSYKMVEWTKRRPLLPFLIGLGIGVVAGHWWQNSACWGA